MNGRVLYVSKDKVIFESPPCTRMVAISGGTIKDDASNRHKFLSFPYVQYTLRKIPSAAYRYAHVDNHHGIKAAFHATVSNTPMTSMDDDVHLMPLPHCFDDSSFCMHPDLKKCKTLPEMLEASIADFWRSHFSHATSFAGHHALADSSLKNYKSWEEKSKKDPGFILGVKWAYPLKISKLPYQPYKLTTHGNSYDV